MDPDKVERSYARTGHYNNRADLQVITESKVTGILIEDGVATGVSFRENGSSIFTHALLQQSGIGPGTVLKKAGIEMLVDLPGVGQNFQDHPVVFTNFVLQNFTVHPNPADMFSNRNFSSWAQEVWRENKTGPYSLGVGNAAAWLGMPVIAPDTFEEIASRLEALDYATVLPTDVHSTVMAGYEAQMKHMAAAIRSKNTAFYNHVLTGGATSGTIVDLHPLSRGTVNIDPQSPFEGEPVVDYRALSNPVDLDIMVEIVRFTRRYYFDTRLKELGPRQIQPSDDVDETEYLKDYLRQSVSPSYFHPVGTCAMMPRDLGGVVDEQLKVYGIKQLRVVDASIMPVLVGANTCQTTYAIAEKAADMIKADG
ncbi:FAD/NAD(P)-binding domain-containing protein [Poronia punctata]|nr:FAD/NAD(P)-binding domain-containing protein [Poronia punctata]